MDLDGGQRALVQHFANAGTVLAVAVGAAGVGKTTAMRAVARAWEMGGGRVVAMANAATAADKLGTEIGIRAQTIARVVTLHRHGLLTEEMLHSGDMLLVDEAGSAGTIELDALRAIAVERGAVIRLVGDWRQSGAPAAGGALRLLAAELGARGAAGGAPVHRPGGGRRRRWRCGPVTPTRSTSTCRRGGPTRPPTWTRSSRRTGRGRRTAPPARRR